MEIVWRVVGLSSFFSMPAAAVVLGIVTRNVWVGLLAFVGSFFQLLIIFSVNGFDFERDEFVLFFPGSLILLVAGMWVADFQGGWWWSVIWLMFGLRFLMHAWNYSVTDKEFQWVQHFLFGFGLLVIGLAFLGPTWLYPRLSTRAEAEVVKEEMQGVQGDGTPDVGATLIAEAELSATRSASSATPQPSSTPTPTATAAPTEGPTETPDAGATQIAEAMLTATARAGGE
jgi:hypothetical protein